MGLIIVKIFRKLEFRTKFCLSLAKNVEKKAAISVDPFITSDLINFDDLSLVLSTHLDQAFF